MRKFCWFWLRLHFLSSPCHGLVEIGGILTSVHRPQYCWGKEPDNRLGRGAALVCCSALEWPTGSNLSPSPRAPPTSGGRSPPSAGCTARGPSLHTHPSAIPGTGATLSWSNTSLAQNDLLIVLILNVNIARERETGKILARRKTRWYRRPAWPSPRCPAGPGWSCSSGRSWGVSLGQGVALLLL